MSGAEEEAGLATYVYDSYVGRAEASAASSVTTQFIFSGRDHDECRFGSIDYLLAFDH
jgi:hypothetical protein